MRFLSKTKDGGSNSPVDAYFLFEIKWLGSIALLKFNKGGREEFHNHAFHALTWFLKGHLLEQDADLSLKEYTRSWFPKITKKSKLHRVKALRDSWCLTIRGPWEKTWYEYCDGKKTTFTHGRKIVSEGDSKGL
jgi:hypothetical protein